MSKWFTSDWHLGHNAAIEYGQRPFKDTEEMSNQIIKNMFSYTRRGDDLYFLGDLAWGKEWIEIVLEEATKRKIRFRWILGNHDMRYANLYKNRIKVFNKHNSMHEMIEIKLTDKEGKHYPTTLCHYPMFTYNKSHYNAFLLFGHHHATTHGAGVISQFEKQGKRLNVNCEFHDYRPVSEIEIIEAMRHKPNNWDLIDK